MHILVHISPFLLHFAKAKSTNLCVEGTSPSTNDIMFLCKTQVDGRVQLCSIIPLTCNVGASGYICFVTLGLGRGLRFAFVSFGAWVS